MPKTPAAASGKLSIPTKLFYGFGSVAFGVKDQGFSYLLLIFYNQVVGLPSATVGLAIMVALLFDSLLDPIMGQVSDNWRSKWGRRHPFMYAAAVPVAISYLLLWNPPDWSQEALFFYLIFVAVVIRSFITMYEIPSAALAPELTTDYDERTKVLSYRYFFGWFGGLTMTVLALQVFLKPDATHPVGQLNPAGYQVYALVASAIMFGAIMISAMGTHRHIARFKPPPVRKITIGKLAAEMFSTLTHRSFLVLMGAGLFNAMAQGLVLSLNLYLTTFFWELSAGQVAFLAGGNFISAALAFALAAPLSKRLGKKPAAQLTKVLAFVISFIPISLRLFDVFPANGAPAVIPLLFLQTALSTAFSIIASILISSMIADVVEDSELRTGRRSEGLFFSAAAFVAKAVSGVGIFASSMILVFVGFPQGAKPGQVPIDVVRELGVVYLIVLAALYGAAITCVSLYRITRAGHEETLSRLAAAAAKEGEGPATVG
ncbi:MFS transporter [Phenylobacterium sp.]|uniref:MFS transporter n=1 Tax=Phenylobacterium sp. TaxID=1871053 RepID=UPI0027339508|nr:MFS transporter [Phenylobacterium sp.]MDP3853464.1 MFS transporter [Phenylobacterium sp.]